MLLFSGLRFHLSGFDRAQECEFIEQLERHGGKLERSYSPECTHVIVSEHTYDDPVCAAARKDNKALVTKDWVKDCVNHSALMDASSVLYTPVRDPSGIPGCKNFCMCLTGYTGQVRKEIEKMVRMMGSSFSKPLIAKQVTHLICYKFDGQKYEFGTQLGLKIVNHRWLEDCLRHWKVMDENDYSISGWELEQAEAKELEEAKTRAQEAEAKELEEAQTRARELEAQAKELEEAKARAKETPELGLNGVVEAQTAGGNEAAPMEVEEQQKPPEAEAEAKSPDGANAKQTKSFDSEATTQQYDIDDDASTENQQESQKPGGVLEEELQQLLVGDKTPPSLNKRKSVFSSTPEEGPGTSSKRHATSNGDTTGTSIAFGDEGKSTPIPGDGSDGADQPDKPEGDQPPEQEKNVVSEKKAEKPEHPPTITIDEEDDSPAPPPKSSPPPKPPQIEIVDLEASLSKKSSSSKSKQSKGKGAMEADAEYQMGRRATRRGGKNKAPKNPNQGRGRPRIFPKEMEGVDEENRRHFAVSGHTQEKKKLTGMIRRLYGHVCRDDHSWKENTTHVIIPELRRTEKFLAALASGRWILKAEYIEASDKAGRFLEEEEYEWYGSGSAEEGRIDLQAPRKWRLEKQKTGCGAFEGLRVVIYGECILPPLATLKRGIKAGGGTVLATSPPYRQHLIAGIDFAIIAVGIPQDDPTVAELLKSKVACVRDEYFVEFICNPSAPLHKHILFNSGAAVEKALVKLEKTKASPPKKKSLGYEAGKLDESGDEEKGDEEEEEDQACSVCKSRDKEEVMLLCDGCNNATHTFCCVPPLAEVPAEDWFCRKCSAAKNKSNMS